MKSTAHIFGLFGDQKHSDLVNKIWLIHESRYVTTSKLDWAVVLLRVMRDEIKNQCISARDCESTQRPASVRTLLICFEDHENGMPGNRNRSTRRRALKTGLRKSSRKVKNRSCQKIMRYLSDAVNLYQTPFEPGELHTINNLSPDEQFEANLLTN